MSTSANEVFEKNMTTEQRDAARARADELTLEGRKANKTTQVQSDEKAALALSPKKAEVRRPQRVR